MLACDHPQHIELICYRTIIKQMQTSTKFPPASYITYNFRLSTKSSKKGKTEKATNLCDQNMIVISNSGFLITNRSLPFLKWNKWLLIEPKPTC